MAAEEGEVAAAEAVAVGAAAGAVVTAPAAVLEAATARTTGYLLGFPAISFSVQLVLLALCKLMCKGENQQYQAYVLRLKTY